MTHELSPGTEVIAVQPTGAPAMSLSWRAGEVVTTQSVDTFADGVAGRHPIPEVLVDLLEVVDDVALVGEDSIKRGMRHLFEHAGLVVEPSAALGVAAMLEDPDRFAGRTVVTVVCGSNILTSDFLQMGHGGTALTRRPSLAAEVSPPRPPEVSPMS